MHLQFVESESTFAYFHATRAYLEVWGKPVPFYRDKHGVFRVNQRGALGGDGMSQFGRAWHALNAYRTIDKIQTVDQGAIIENKRLSAALAFIR